MLIFAPSLLALVAAAGPVSFDPVDPRLGDLVNVYVENSDAGTDRGAVRLLGYEAPLFRVGPNLMRATAAVPVDIAPGKYPVRVLFPRVEVGAEIEIHDREFEATELKVNRRYTSKKSKALRRRLKREEKEFEALWSKMPQRPSFIGSMVIPVAGETTAVFGTHRLFNKKSKSRHYGLDLNGQVGDRVNAIAAGKVVLSSNRFVSGGTIVIDHGGGLFSMYFHLSRRTRKVGARVKAGDLIGAVGKTGRVTGPHLHLALGVRSIPVNEDRMGKPRVLYVDPERALTLDFRGDPSVLALRRGGSR